MNTTTARKPDAGEIAVTDLVRTIAGRIWQAVWRRDPTRGWRADPSVPLVLDLDDHRLSGVGPGDRLDDLSFLGPAEEVVSGELRYPSLGLTVATCRGRVAQFRATFADPDDRARPFGGRVVLRGRPVPLSPATREEDLVRWFGPPYYRDEGEAGVNLIYAFGGDRERWFLFGPDGRLRGVTVQDEPDLADPEFREEAEVIPT